MYAFCAVPWRFLQGPTPTRPCQQAASVSPLPAPAPHCLLSLAHAHPRTGAQSDVRVPLRTAVTAGAYRGFVRGCGASPHSLFGCIPGFTPLQMSAVELNVWSSAKICTICWLFRFGFAPGAAFSVVHAVQHRILTHGVCRACMMAPVTTRAATLVLRQSRQVDPRLVALIRVIRLKEPALTAAH